MAPQIRHGKSERQREQVERDHPQQRRVFADLDFPHAEERQTKLRLAYALNAIMKCATPDAGCRRSAAPPQLAKVFALRNYKLRGFSVERLMRLLNALDQVWRSSFARRRAHARRHASAWWRRDGSGLGLHRA
jgi:hypothetical protein